MADGTTPRHPRTTPGIADEPHRPGAETMAEIPQPVRDRYGLTEEAVQWATEERGCLTPRLDREDAEKWAALGADRGRQAVAVLPAADLDALTARAEKAEATLRDVANRLYFLAAPLAWAADGNNYLRHIEGYITHLTARAERAEAHVRAGADGAGSDRG